MTQRTNGLTQVPPIEYPIVTILGVAYSVKFSLLAQFSLDSWGVDVSQIGPTLAPQIPDGIDEATGLPKFKPDPTPRPGKVAMAMKLFAACTAHNFVEDKQPIRTAEEWAAIIPGEQWGECCQAMGLAMRKAAPPVAPSPAPAEATVGLAN